MKLALAQINTTVGDLSGNVARIMSAARSAASKSPDLIAFPEMAVPGYPPRDILYDASFATAVQSATRDLANQAKGLPPLLVGSLARSEKKLYEHPALYNIAYLLHHGELHVAQIKQILPIYDVFYEPRWFVPGKETMPPIDIAGSKVGVLICEDMWDEEYPVHPGTELKRMSAQMLVCISASPYRRGAREGRLYHAKRQELPIAFVNLVGANDELIFDGGSFVLGGERLGMFEEEIRIIEFSTTKTNGTKVKADAEYETFNALVLGLRDFARKNGLERAFVGLSGGIDSSVTAVIAAEALGKEHVMGIAIPSRYTDPRSTESARDLAKLLGIKFEVVELESLHKEAESTLGKLLEGNVASENVQARLRMMILMSYVNRYGGFLISTSNKTELTMGYSTLYGDMAGTISPLGDLTKLEVYALARWINSRSVVISDFVMDRVPSAELRENQVDPFDYAKISPEVEKLVLANQSNSAMRQSEHKRWQMGLVLKVSEKSFGRGRIMPITRK